MLTTHITVDKNSYLYGKTGTIIPFPGLKISGSYIFVGTPLDGVFKFLEIFTEDDFNTICKNKLIGFGCDELFYYVRRYWEKSSDIFPALVFDVVVDGVIQEGGITITVENQLEFRRVSKKFPIGILRRALIEDPTIFDLSR